MGAATQQRASRVFVLEPVKQRLDDAKRFGQLSYIFPRDAARASIWDSDELANEILDILRRAEYDPQADYIVVTGHQIPLSIAVAAITAEYGEFQVLFFNATDHCYVERVLG